MKSVRIFAAALAAMVTCLAARADAQAPPPAVSKLAEYDAAVLAAQPPLTTEDAIYAKLDELARAENQQGLAALQQECDRSGLAAIGARATGLMYGGLTQACLRKHAKAMAEGLADGNTAAARQRAEQRPPPPRDAGEPPADDGDDEADDGDEDSDADEGARPHFYDPVAFSHAQAMCPDGTQVLRMVDGSYRCRNPRFQIKPGDPELVRVGTGPNGEPLWQEVRPLTAQGPGNAIGNVPKVRVAPAEEPFWCFRGVVGPVVCSVVAAAVIGGIAAGVGVAVDRSRSDVVINRNQRGAR